MRLTLIATFVLLLLAAPARSQGICNTSGVSLFSGHPATLAAEWLPLLENLYAAIPLLSPGEEQWLQEEFQGGGQRRLRAISSREFAVQQAKLNAGSLLASIRHVLGKYNQSQEPSREEQTRSWLFFAYALLEEDSGYYLQKLVENQVIQVQAIPQHWTYVAGEDFPLMQSIRSQRSSLARYILICTLPGVIGVAMRE